MPYTVNDHQDTKVIDLNDFTGGMRTGIPSTQLRDNECELMENMFLDPRSGRPRTRYPITSYSTTAAPSAVNGLYIWGTSSTQTILLTTTTGYMYYLSSLVPTSIGTLSSTTRPSFCVMGDRLYVASGGVIQYTTTVASPAALANMTGSPSTVSILFEQYSRLVSSGDSTNTDRIYEGTYADSTTWNTEDYADVGYLDGTSIVAVTEAFEGMYIVFKRGRSGLRTYYATSLTDNPPSANLATDGHAPMGQGGVVWAGSRLLVMEEEYVSALIGTERQGKVEYDPSPGMKLHGMFKATANGFAVLYPPDSQVWFVPDPNKTDVYVYHYLRDAWSLFKFGSRRLYSACYDPVAGFLYLGCDDGVIYKYDKNAVRYNDTIGTADTATDYTQRLVTKTFSSGNREMVLKSPVVHWYYLDSGSGTMYVKFDYGTATQNWGTLTITDGNVYVYDTDSGNGGTDLYVYDTRAGGDDEMYVWPGTLHESARGDYNKPSDTFQFDLSITSGGLSLDRIVAEVSSGRRS